MHINKHLIMLLYIFGNDPYCSIYLLYLNYLIMKIFFKSPVFISTIGRMLKICGCVLMKYGVNSKDSSVFHFLF